jgi:hypothetical protein
MHCKKFWRKRWDSNPRYAYTHGGFQDRCLKPLGHPSNALMIKVFRLLGIAYSWANVGLCAKLVLHCQGKLSVFVIIATVSCKLAFLP